MCINNMNNIIVKILVGATFLSTITLGACRSNKEAVTTTQTTVERTVDNSTMAMPRIVIYKTVADYSNLVPINMDESKTQIVSYPDPRDVKAGKHPTQLNNGYLLDNFGIGRNVVYTDYTYEEYAALPQVPEIETLMQHIIDRNPIVEYYVSNDDYRHTENYRTAEALNKVIANNFAGFTKVDL